MEIIAAAPKKKNGTEVCTNANNAKYRAHVRSEFVKRRRAIQYEGHFYPTHYQSCGALILVLRGTKRICSFLWQSWQVNGYQVKGRRKLPVFKRVQSREYERNIYLTKSF